MRASLRSGARTLASALAMLVVAAGVAFADGDPPPYETVRALQALQDRIATGDTIAQAAYAKSLQRASRSFANATLATWSDKRNARALISYLFSGGNAAGVRAAVPRTAVPADLAALYGGALDYGSGRDEEARAALSSIEAKSLPGGLGSHLALVQATLLAATDPAKAIALLDTARLLEPGSLVEEAALRKEISLIGAAGDLDKLALLARRYSGAFARSIYAENFQQLITKTALQVGGEDRPDAQARLDLVLGSLPRDERRRLYLLVAREAVLDGRIAAASRTSEDAGRLAQPGDTDEARALVYYGAASVVGARYETGMKALAKVPSDKLDAKDRDLWSSALGVGEMIRGPEKSSEIVEAGRERQAVIEDAERSLKEADALLNAAAKDGSP